MLMEPKPRHINRIAGLEEGIAMVGGMLLGISRDEDQRARLESEYKGQLDFQSKMVQRRKGKVEWRAARKTVMKS